MIRRGILGASISKNLAMHISAYATATLALGMTWSPARAEAAEMHRDAAPAPEADHSHSGNGRHNRNALSVRSPIRNHGYQHTNNRNAGGVNDVQSAMCRNVRVCNVTQKVTMIRPERAVPQAPRVEPPAQRPDAPLRRVDPPVRQADPPVRQADPSAAASPVVYMGPYGIMLVPGSNTAATFGTPTENAGPLECLTAMFG